MTDEQLAREDDDAEVYQQLLKQYREWQDAQTLPSSGLTESGWAYKHCADALEEAMADDN